MGNRRPPIAPPTFSPASGTVSDSDKLTITSAAGFTIYYTTNGAPPTTSTTTSGLSPLEVSFGSSGIGGIGSYNIKAIAMKEGHADSFIGSATFTVERDVDADNNGLIEINNLDMLNNIRHNLAGTSYDNEALDSGGDADTGSIIGAPTDEQAMDPGYMCTGRTPSPPNNLCGYELTKDLDFALAASYAGSVNTTWRPTTNPPASATNPGFPGFGAETGDSDGFTGIFEGNGHTIKNLYSRSSNENSRNVGLFRLVNSGAVIRNVGVINAVVSGGTGDSDQVGILAGYNIGTVTASYATGGASARGGRNNLVGGLVGRNDGTIRASHATASVNGAAGNTDYVGGLVGYQASGTITASYASGGVDGGAGTADYVGGLVGNNFRGIIRASYASGRVDGGTEDRNRVGGLVGSSDRGTITASYATGNASGGGDIGGLIGRAEIATITASYSTGRAYGNNKPADRVGGLVGSSRLNTITASYSFGSSHRGATTYGTDGTSKPSGVTSPAGLTSTNVGTSWNSIAQNTLGAWDFTGAVPVPVYADYDGTGDTYSCDDYPEKIPGTMTTIVCGQTTGNTPVGNHRPDIVNAPAFDPPSGSVMASATLTISTSPDDAMIYYTTDGTRPTIESTLYSRAVSFRTIGLGSKTIRAIALKAGHIASSLASASFTITNDVDADDNGLIEIWDLDMLNNIRYNLAGTSYKTSSEASGNVTGARTTEHSNCDDNDGTTTRVLCGYELRQNLDFAIAEHYDSGSTNMPVWTPTGGNPDAAMNGGFPGFGAETGDSGGFTGIFEGNGHTINNLYIRANGRVGLFRLVSSGAVIRNVGVTNARVYAVGSSNNVGGLAGANAGTISASHASGNIHTGGGDNDRAGGLVGVNQSTGRIRASYAEGKLEDAGGNRAALGGLVGRNDRGEIVASYSAVDSNVRAGTFNFVGGFVGINNGTIRASYAIGNADGGPGGTNRVGGLVGSNSGTSGTITASYATGNADGGAGTDDYVGALAGFNSATITASYAFGTVAGGEITGHNGDPKPSGVAAAYDLKGDSGDATTYAGALWNNKDNNTLGAWSFGTSTRLPAPVYADYDGSGGAFPSCSPGNGGFSSTIPGSSPSVTLTCGQSLVGGYRPTGVSTPTFTPAEGTVLDSETVTISTSTPRATIYYIAGANPGDPTSSNTEYNNSAKPTFSTLVEDIAGNYPKTVTVKAIAVKDGNVDSIIVSATFTVERDVDADNNGLMEIDNLDMLNNIRHNLAGTTYDDEADDGRGNFGSTTGASTTEPDACDDNRARTIITLCGYELTQDLDFASATHYASGSVNTDWRPTTGVPDSSTNTGFPGFGAGRGTTGGFAGIFEGNGHTIDNLYIRTDDNAGLFRLVEASAVIRNVGVTNANVYGGNGIPAGVGGLAGVNAGTISASHASGSANSGGGLDSRVGGLVGVNRGTIRASYATGRVDGGTGNTKRFVGGLVGYNDGGTITASYATGNANGGTANDDEVGGLVGSNSGTVTASYATGNANGGGGNNDYAGGLVGRNGATGTVTASYAIGNANGGGGTGDYAGALVGSGARSTVTASYAFGRVTGETAGHNGTGKPTAVLEPHDLKGDSGDATTYAGASWNDTSEGTLGAWNFGTTSQVPAPVYADYDGSGNAHNCNNYPAKIPGTTITLRCGIANPSLVGNYRPSMVEIPTISLANGNILTSQTLTISTRTTGASIRYTTDTSDPLSSSAEVSASTSATLDLEALVGMKTIRVIATRTGYINSVEALRFFNVQRDVDMNNNGLIEISNLDMLRNMHYDLAGTSYKTSASGSGSTAGQPTSRPPACTGRTTNLCGYELTGSLNFTTATHYASRTVRDAWRTAAGFPGIGRETGITGGFTGIFEGNGHTIDNLFMSSNGNIGLFRLVGASGIIRNIGVTNVNVYGGNGSDHVGALAGYNRRGRITASYATGTANGGDGSDQVGGLVGSNDAGTITASYATSTANGGDGNDNVGGLVGYSATALSPLTAKIIASYATGAANGGDGNEDRVGGLVGNNNNGAIAASYATGTADGGDGNDDEVGGLVGETFGFIVASYATGVADGGAGTTDRVGALAGSSNGVITASYAFGRSSAGRETTGHEGSTKPSGVTMPTGLTASNAGESWNTSDLSSLYLRFGFTYSFTFTTSGAWSFASGKNPALVYNDYDGSKTDYPSCSDNNGGFLTTIPGSITATKPTGDLLTCGRTPLPGQGR